MATTADFKNGLYLDYNGKPCQIVWFQHVKPGKGPAFVKTKLRNLENGRILENTFTAGAKIDTINVERRPYQFLYKDEDGFNFMHATLNDHVNDCIICTAVLQRRIIVAAFTIYSQPRLHIDLNAPQSEGILYSGSSMMKNEFFAL